MPLLSPLHTSEWNARNDWKVQARGGDCVSRLKGFSRTRWVDQNLWLRLYIDNLPGMRWVLLSNTHDSAGFKVPDTVTAVVQDSVSQAAAAPAAPILCFLFRISAAQEADASPLSCVLGLHTSTIILLRSEFQELVGQVWVLIEQRIRLRVSKRCPPAVVLAFFLDSCDSRRRAWQDLWGSSTLAQWRDKGIAALYRDDGALKSAFQRDVASSLSFVDTLPVPDSSTLHPFSLWRMSGDRCLTVQVIATL